MVMRISAKMAFEEVVPGNKDQFFRISGLPDNLLQRLVRAKLVVDRH